MSSQENWMSTWFLTKGACFVQLFATSNEILMSKQGFAFPSKFFERILSKSIYTIYSYNPEPDCVTLLLLPLCQGAALAIKADSTGMEKSSAAFVQKMTQGWF